MQPGNDILIGSRSLIIQLLNSGLIDEFQIRVHPVIEGKGLKLFEELSGQVRLKPNYWIPGPVVLCYEARGIAEQTVKRQVSFDQDFFSGITAPYPILREGKQVLLSLPHGLFFGTTYLQLCINHLRKTLHSF